MREFWTGPAQNSPSFLVSSIIFKKLQMTLAKSSSDDFFIPVIDDGFRKKLRRSQMKAIGLFFSTLFFFAAAGAAEWHCGTLSKYQTKYESFAVVGDMQTGPAITVHTKDPKKLKKHLKYGKCYCVKGNVVNVKFYGNMFKKINGLSGCGNWNNNWPGGWHGDWDGNNDFDLHLEFDL